MLLWLIIIYEIYVVLIHFTNNVLSLFNLCDFGITHTSIDFFNCLLLRSYETSDAPNTGTSNYIAKTIYSGITDAYPHFLINQIWKWRKKHASYTRTFRTYEHYTNNPLSQESLCEKLLDQMRIWTLDLSVHARASECSVTAS